MADYSKDILRKQKRWAALELERSSFFGHWQEIAQFLMPRSGRFLVSDRNKGQKKHNSIYDSTGSRALRILAAGLMAGMTSPARPWFRLKTPDDDLNEQEAVMRWLDVVTRRMRDVFNSSNTYRALHAIYEELGAFGTAACFILEDFQHVVHCSTLTIGEYVISLDAKGAVVALYRKFDMTVDQLVTEFGIDAVSVKVRDAYNDARALDAWITVMHVVEPRAGTEVGKLDSKNMPWASCYFEMSQHEGRYLRESGFKRLPALAPRWKVTSNDIYGESPGMEALGDVKQLQHQQLRKAQGIDAITQPPLQMPTMLRGKEVQSQPGGNTYVDSAGTQQAIRPLFEVDLNLRDLLGDIQDVRSRINDAFYVPLFLMLANDERAQITAREIAERHEEKLLMLGPVLERLHNELLGPLIDITFDRMIEAGIVPPAPPELHGIELKVEFVSMLAQAQKAVGITSVDRLLGTVGGFAQVRPDMLDKLDVDEIVDKYADMLGIDPTMILSDDKVAEIRKERAKQQQAMMQAQTAPAAAQTAKTLSETNTTDKNALTDAVGMFSGYGPQR